MVATLHVTASMSPEWGGPPAVVAGLTGALQQWGIRSEIVTAAGRWVGTGLLPTPDIAVHAFRTEYPARIWKGYSRKLARFLDEEIPRFDLVHVHGIWHYPAWMASRITRRRGVPCVVSLHDELSAAKLRHKWFRKRVYRNLILDRILRSADALHVLTRAERSRVAELGYDTPVFLSPNGIGLDTLDAPASPDASDFLARHPRLAGKRVILFLGRLHPSKGTDVLARSFVRIAPRFPDTVLLVAGPDEVGPRHGIERILRSAGLVDRVVITGMLTGADKLAALTLAELFVLPSRSEGMSVAVLEALAAGLPVVISEQYNFPEVGEAGAGFVVPRDEASFTEAIGALLSGGQVARSMGRRGRRLVTEHHTWPSIAGSMADFYRTTAGRRRRRASAPRRAAPRA